MGAFDSVTKKISSLVGITAKGQAAKANSLPIALASDQVGPAGTPAQDALTVQGIPGGAAVLSSVYQDDNPYRTAEGEIITSQAETFWVRLAREGVEQTGFGSVILSTAFNSTTIGKTGLGRRLYVDLLSISTDVAAEVKLTLAGHLNAHDHANNTQVSVLFHAFVAAGVPWVLTFPGGGLFMEDGGICSAYGLVATGAGNLRACLHGYEVSIYA